MKELNQYRGALRGLHAKRDRKQTALSLTVEQRRILKTGCFFSSQNADTIYKTEEIGHKNQKYKVSKHYNR